METIRVRRESGVRTILGLLVVAALAVIGVLAWNQWAANNTQLSIVYPTDKAELAGNTVPVRLAASQSLQDKLNSPGGQVQIITYLDGKEVGRGQALNYSLTSVAPGEHQLEIGLSDQTTSNSVSLSVMPKPVSFTLGGGMGAANPLPTASNSLNGIYGNVPSAPDDSIALAPTATAAAAPAPAVPAPTQPPVQVPATGEGGGSKLAALAQPAGQVVAGTGADTGQPVAQANVANSETARQAAQAGTSLNVSSTQPNKQAVIAAETASQAKAADPMSGVFRGIFAFYVAGFIVGLGLIVVLRRRRGKVI